jgi:hypothetical protein
MLKMNRHGRCTVTGVNVKSEGPEGPCTKESVSGVATARDKDYDGSDNAEVPSPGIAVSFVTAARIIALGKLRMLVIRFFVKTFCVVVILREPLHRERDESVGGLALVHCCQFFDGFCIVGHEIHLISGGLMSWRRICHYINLN